MEDFELLSELSDIETIAVGTAIRDLPRLRRLYGMGRSRKKKGVARVCLRTGRGHLTELHWYGAHSIGRKEIKRKRNLD